MAYSITPSCIGCTSCAKLCPTKAAQGVKKEIHRIEEGLCIECGACGRICPKEAVLDPFGCIADAEKKKLWKKPVYDHKTCMACGVCVEACPVGCIILGEPNSKSKTAFPYLAYRDACLACGFCAHECPVESITLCPPE